MQQHDVEVAMQQDVAQGAEPWFLVEAEGPVQAPHVEIQHAQAHLQIHTWLRFKIGFEIRMSTTPLGEGVQEGRAGRERVCNAERNAVAVKGRFLLSGH